MLNRVEFINHFEKHGVEDAADPTCPLWIPETFDDKSITCEYFICIRPLDLSATMMKKQEYWKWIRKNLKGDVRCFSSSSEAQEEWWGFTNKDDIVIWMLRWS